MTKGPMRFFDHNSLLLQENRFVNRRQVTLLARLLLPATALWVECGAHLNIRKHIKNDRGRITSRSEMWWNRTHPITPESGANSQSFTGEQKGKRFRSIVNE